MIIDFRSSMASEDVVWLSEIWCYTLFHSRRLDHSTTTLWTGLLPYTGCLVRFLLLLALFTMHDIRFYPFTGNCILTEINIHSGEVTVKIGFAPLLKFASLGHLGT